MPSEPKVDLLPCPCCDNPGHLITDRVKGTFKIKCAGCEMQTKASLYRDEVISAWNARQTNANSIAVGGALEADSEIRVAIQRALIATLGDVYDCTRVWSAWGYGTMDEHDFVPVLDRMDEIIDELIAQLAATPTKPLAVEADEVREFAAKFLWHEFMGQKTAYLFPDDATEDWQERCYAFADRLIAALSVPAEPVAWMYVSPLGTTRLYPTRWNTGENWTSADFEGHSETPLYAAPLSGAGVDAEELARELWWPHHESRTRATALAALDGGDPGRVTLEFGDILNIVRAAQKDQGQ